MNEAHKANVIAKLARDLDRTFSTEKKISKVLESYFDDEITAVEACHILAVFFMPEGEDNAES